MARKTKIDLFDDFTEEPNATRVRFSVDGVDYEIDLAHDNEQKLREVFAPYIAAARMTQPQRTTRTRRTEALTTSPREPRYSKEYLTKVREFARNNGHNVGDRGRVHHEHIEAYQRFIRDGGIPNQDHQITEPAPEIPQPAEETTGSQIPAAVFSS